MFCPLLLEANFWDNWHKLCTGKFLTLTQTRGLAFFFIHHWTSGGRDISAFMLALPFHYQVNLSDNLRLTLFTPQSINQSKLFVTRAMSCTVKWFC